MNTPHFNNGIGILVAILKQAGHLVDYFCVTESLLDDSILSYVDQYSPDLIGFSSNTLQWFYVKKYAALIKSRFQTPIICGGCHPTFKPDEVIQDQNIDMICVGEGEVALKELLERMSSGKDISSIPNIWLKNEAGKIIKNDLGPLIIDLDLLPFADRSIVPYQTFINNYKVEPIFITSRGCPFHCTFCANSAYKKLYKGKGNWVRKRSPQHVIQEIQALREKYHFNTMNFYDECFGYHKKWITEFCHLYKQEFRYPFGCLIRAGTVDREWFRMMADAGLSIIYIGVESGNETIRKKVMNRNISDAVILKTCKDAMAEGIQVWTFNVIGVPGETVSTIDETMALNKLINPHFIQVSIYQPFPGTLLHDYCVENNLFAHANKQSNFFTDSCLRLPTISSDNLIKKYNEFQTLALETRREHERKGDCILLNDF